MVFWLLLGLALLLLGLAGLRWYASADPRAVLRALRWAAAVAGVALLLLVVLGAGRQLLALALPLLLPVMAQLPHWLRRMRAASGPSPGGSSAIETRFLRMRLDHDSGAMEGTVLEGPFRGRHLAELSEAELIELWRDCRAGDEQSAAVLEAYLDRTHGADWRAAAGAGQPGGDSGEDPGEGPGQARRERRYQAASGGMSREEACQVLGVLPDADEAAIKAAHRRLMQQFHPDHGGSDYLAAKINQAKQVLLGR